MRDASFGSCTWRRGSAWEGPLPGYRLAFIEENGAVLAAAGYRVAEYLAWGRVLYIDDLITLETDRSRGFGGFLMDWLLEQARESGCAQVHLDSGVQRFGAHRLYLKKRMDITCHHFSRPVPTKG